jgi:hypothetical protein
VPVGVRAYTTSAESCASPRHTALPRLLPRVARRAAAPPRRSTRGYSPRPLRGQDASRRGQSAGGGWSRGAVKSSDAPAPLVCSPRSSATAGRDGSKPCHEPSPAALMRRERHTGFGRGLRMRAPASDQRGRKAIIRVEVVEHGRKVLEPVGPTCCGRVRRSHSTGGRCAGLDRAHGPLTLLAANGIAGDARGDAKHVAVQFLVGDGKHGALRRRMIEPSSRRGHHIIQVVGPAGHGGELPAQALHHPRLEHGDAVLEASPLTGPVWKRAIGNLLEHFWHSRRNSDHAGASRAFILHEHARVKGIPCKATHSFLDTPGVQQHDVFVETRRCSGSNPPPAKFPPIGVAHMKRINRFLGLAIGALISMAAAHEAVGHDASNTEAERFARPLRDLEYGFDYYEVAVNGVVMAVMYDQICMVTSSQVSCTSHTAQCSHIGGACTYCAATGTAPVSNSYCVPATPHPTNVCQVDQILSCGNQHSSICTGVGGTCLTVTTPAIGACQPRTCLAS